MKRFALMALASGLAIAAATPASATITISTSTNNGAITQVATDNGNGTVNYNTTTGGYFFNVSATGTPLTASIFDLITQSVNIQQTSGTGGLLSIFITDTNLPTLNGNLMSSFTSQIFSGSTTGVTISSFVSPTNTTGGTLLQSNTFTGLGTFMGGNAVNQTGPFATTIRYDLTFGAGNGTFNGTANLTAVPEPATWGMMIMGFGLLGGVMRRRSTKVAFA